MSEQMAEGLEDLSPRLREVLLLVAEGKTNQEIGDELSIKMETARNHVHLLARQIGVSGTPENRNVRVKLIRWLFLNNGYCIDCASKDKYIEELEKGVRLCLRVVGEIVVLHGSPAIISLLEESGILLTEEEILAFRNDIVEEVLR